jgi:pimeloyl-ACP methyl ester carboxylesterase
MELRFGDCSIDCDQYVFSRAGKRVDLQPKVWAFIKFLAENAHRVVAKEEILDRLWPEVVVSEGSLQRLASLAREVLGPDDVLRTIRGVGYQLTAPVEIIDAPAANSNPESSDSAQQSPARSAPQIRFCRTVDGVNVAWKATGEGSPVVRALGWFTNLEQEAAWAPARRFWEVLGEQRQLVCYDGRGMGLSDPTTEFSAESRLRDFEAVVAAAEIERFDIVGMSEGCGTAIRYALRNPDRVRRLVLYGPPAFLFRGREDEDRALGKVMISLVDAAWGSGSGVFGRMLAEIFVGQSASSETRDLFDRMQRASTDKETAITYFRSMARGERPDIAALRVPTLIAHRRDDVIAPFEAARAAARKIPGARLVALEGDNHWPMADDPDAPVLLRTIRQFLDED